MPGARRNRLKVLVGNILLRSRIRWLVVLTMLVVIVMTTWRAKTYPEPSVYQALYQSTARSGQEAAHLATLLGTSKTQQAACKRHAPSARKAYCRQAGQKDEQVLHLARPFRSGPETAHGTAVISATLSMVKGELVAAVILTDPRDWLSVDKDKVLHDAAKEHLWRIERGESLVSCSFFTGGNADKAGGSRKQVFGRAVLHPDKKVLVVLCPLPEEVSCCVLDQLGTLAGKHGASPICVHLQAALESLDGQPDRLRTIDLFDYSVCKFGQFYDKVSLAVLLDPHGLSYFPQWMAYHQWLGVQRVVVYLVNGTDLALAKGKLLPYLSDGSVIISAWNVSSSPAPGQRQDSTPSVSSSAPQPSPQLVAIGSPWKATKPDDDGERESRLMTALHTDCLYRYRHSSDVMLILDAHQYVLWRNNTGTDENDNKGVQPTSAAVAASAIQDILPRPTGEPTSTVYTIKQAVFLPPVGPAASSLAPPDPTSTSTQRSLIPYDLSAIMRCLVGEGVKWPRYGYRFAKMELAWPGGGAVVNGGPAVAEDWSAVRINAYHNHSGMQPGCETKVLDMGMHQPEGWTLLDTVAEAVRLRHDVAKLDN